MDTSTSPTSPTGTVTFSSSSSGSFNPSTTCTLSSASSSTSSCSVSYIPAPGSEGTHVITGSYSGDGTHTGSSGTSSLTVTKRTTATSVTCSPFGASPGHPTTCSATVKDTSPGTPITPTGSVTWVSSGTGKFSSTSCTSAIVGTLTCTGVYSPSPGKPSLQTITATYGGDTDHSGSGRVRS